MFVCCRFQLLFNSVYNMYVLYQAALSVLNKASKWKCYHPVGCDAVYSDKFFDILEEHTINVCSIYEVDGFRNVGKII
jgi:hypothetical protein